ncbi:serine carboxypeptidase-like 18 [Coffea arabica]|uniref:Serine carboxypeptidase-like 18 n=1 Tax=Coffea arabica TaxID=13443 RepID=A0A6P6VEB9_COFAR
MHSQVDNDPTPSSQNRRDNDSSSNRKNRDSRKSRTLEALSGSAKRARNGGSVTQGASNNGAATQGASNGGAAGQGASNRGAAGQGETNEGAATEAETEIGGDCQRLCKQIVYITNAFHNLATEAPLARGLARLLQIGNGAGIEPHTHLKGYILGNPAPTTQGDGNHAIPFAHRMALISDELYESLKATCKGEYVNIDPSNAPCLKNIQAYNKLIDNIEPMHVLEPTCPDVSPKPNNLFSGRRSTVETFYKKFEELDVLEFNPVECRVTGEEVLYYWANDRSVQEALHVRKGTIKEWIRCNYSILYTINAGSAVPYHANLSTKGYRSLIYSGDHDMISPYLGTEEWIRSLNYPTIDDWRQWIHQGQVAGYTRTYANKMTFATVKGAGHAAPYYKPAECRSMFGRWISYQPL